MTTTDKKPRKLTRKRVAKLLASFERDAEAALERGQLDLAKDLTGLARRTLVAYAEQRKAAGLRVPADMRQAVSAASKFLDDEGGLKEPERDANGNGLDDSDEETVVLPNKLRREIGEPTADLIERYLTEVRDYTLAHNSRLMRKCLALEGENGENTTLHKLLSREIGAIGVRAIKDKHGEICKAFSKAMKSVFDAVLESYLPPEPEPADVEHAALGLTLDKLEEEAGGDEQQEAGEADQISGSYELDFQPSGDVTERAQIVVAAPVVLPVYEEDQQPAEERSLFTSVSDPAQLSAPPVEAIEAAVEQGAADREQVKSAWSSGSNGPGPRRLTRRVRF